MPRKNTDWEREFQKVAKEYKKLAKRANQRMVRLERYSLRPGYSGVLGMAYRVAQQDIKGLYQKKGEKLRYTETPKMYEVKKNGKKLEGQEKAKANVQALKAKMKSINAFLESKSSTIADIKMKDPFTGKVLRDAEGKPIIAKEGIDTLYDKRTTTLNKRLKDMYGFEADLTPQDLKRFFDSRKQAKLQNLVGSDMMFIVAAVMRDKQIAANKRELQSFFRNHINLDDIGLDAKDLNIKRDASGKLESTGDYFERLSEFIELTGNQILDDYVKDAIREGIGYKQIFI